MANPQKENGYTAIANEIIEKLAKLNLTSSQWQVLMFILRKTYGWHKKEDNISLTQIEEGTNLSRPTVCFAIKELVKQALLVKSSGLLNKKKKRINRYGFQKNYEKWTSRPRLTSKAQRTSNGKFQRTSNSKAQRTHKRNYYKRNYYNRLVKKPTEKKKKSLRTTTTFPKEWYDAVLKAYQELKGVELHGPEFDPIMQAIKSMFLAKRKPEEIIKCMEWFEESEEEWTDNWTINTIKIKLPEFSGGKLEEDFVIPSYAKDWIKN